jgi:hypothetical protein
MTLLRYQITLLGSTVEQTRHVIPGRHNRDRTQGILTSENAYSQAFYEMKMNKDPFLRA